MRGAVKLVSFGDWGRPNAGRESDSGASRAACDMMCLRPAEMRVPSAKGEGMP